MKKKRFKFQIKLTVFIVITILVGAVSMTFISQQLGKNAALVAAQNIFAGVSKGVSQEINHFFKSSIAVIDTMSCAPVMRLSLPRGEFDDPRIAYMRNVLDINPHFSSLYVGAANGDLVQTISLKNAPQMRQAYTASQHVEYICRVISNAYGRKLQLWQYYDPVGGPLDVRVDGNPKYDPRERPWYKAAYKQQSAIVTAPYVFSSSKVPGITCAIFLKGGSMVLGADITINKLDTILSSYTISKNSKIIIINKKKQVIINPNKKNRNPANSVQINDASRADEPWLRQVAKDLDAIITKNNTAKQIRIDGKPYLAMAVAVDAGLRTQTGMYTVMLAPISDFTGHMEKMLWSSIWITLGLVFLETLLASYISQKISKSQVERDEALDVISGSIRYASRIQKAILPGPETFDAAASGHFVVWKPRDVVSGDVYLSAAWGDGFLFVLGDCTGHGVPGAFMTLIASGAINRARNDVQPGHVAELMQRMHQIMQQSLNQHTLGGDSDDGMELGVLFVRPTAGTICFVGARFPLFVQEDDEITEIKADKRGIGYRHIPFHQEFTENLLEIKPGLRLYMVSDGLIDQIGGERRRSFGKKRFKELLSSLSGLPLSKQGELIYQALIDYQGQESRRDDVSILGLDF